MQQLCPEKEFIIAPTAGSGATCRSCANCPWMAMNALDNLQEVLEMAGRIPSGAGHPNEIFVDEIVRVRAMQPLQRMLDFAKRNA